MLVSDILPSLLAETCSHYRMTPTMYDVVLPNLLIATNLPSPLEKTGNTQTGAGLATHKAVGVLTLARRRDRRRPTPPPFSATPQALSRTSRLYFRVEEEPPAGAPSRTLYDSGLFFAPAGTVRCPHGSQAWTEERLVGSTVIMPSLPPSSTHRSHSPGGEQHRLSSVQPAACPR